jgi:hypothetical protein
MRALPVRRVSRIVAFAVPTVAAMLLAACGNVTGPREAQPHRDTRSTAVRATQLDGGQVSDDTTGRTPTQPWY